MHHHEQRQRALTLNLVKTSPTTTAGRPRRPGRSAPQAGPGYTTYELTGTAGHQICVTFAAGTYDLSETGPGEQEDAASCLELVENGAAADDGASIRLAPVTPPPAPSTTTTTSQAHSISTVMKWTLNDRSTMTGWVPGGTASTVTFTLYKDTATESSCQASTQVFTRDRQRQ